MKTTNQQVEAHAGELVGTFGSFAVTVVRKGEKYGRGLSHDKEVSIQTFEA